MFSSITNLDYKQKLKPNLALIYEIAVRVFENLGAGHSEFVYHRAMEVELRSRNIAHETEKRVTISYPDIHGNIYTLGEERIDLFLLEERIIIELKAMINPPKENDVEQVNKYYRELKKMGNNSKIGIIINFPQSGAKSAKDCIDFFVVNFV